MSEEQSQKLSIGQLFRDVAGFLRANATRLTQAILPAAAVFVALEAVRTAHLTAETEAQAMGAGLLISIGKALVFVHIAVTTHRMALVDDDQTPRWGLRPWTMRETRFAGWSLALYILLAVFVAVPVILGVAIGAMATPEDGAAFALTSISMLMMVGIYFAGIYVFARLTVLFPATAIDRRPDAAWAWNLTTGNGWRIFLGTMVIPGLILTAIAALLGAVFGVFLPMPLAMLALEPLVVVGMVWEIALLSYTYRQLNGPDDTPLQEAPMESLSPEPGNET